MMMMMMMMEAYFIFIGLDDVTYNARTVFPEWILKNSNWRGGELIDEVVLMIDDDDNDNNDRGGD
jgi:hypothetical protein